MVAIEQRFPDDDGDRALPARASSASSSASHSWQAMGLLGRAVAADIQGFMRSVKRPRIGAFGKIIAALVGLACLGLLAMSLALLWALQGVPLNATPDAKPVSVVVEAADGRPLGRVGPFDDAVERKDFPRYVVDAVLAIEDRRFNHHWGIDPLGIMRAVGANLSAGEVIQGGSTITQQLAKMDIVGSERTFDRKFREALIAIWLDLRLSKDEILTRYLNRVYLGSGARGMSAGARLFFDKKLDELTLAEAAMLAGLIQAPSRYSPFVDADAARRRADEVLNAMVEVKSIDRKTADRAIAEPAKAQATRSTAPAASWFADWIAKDELTKVAGRVSRPMRVQTTLMPALQELAASTIEDVLKREGSSKGIGQAALVALRPDGAVLAMVGGRDYQESQFNRAVDALRQPGSAFKLFVYYAALRAGYRLDQTVDASPVEIKGWRPGNYSGERYGLMTLAEAFAKSVNSAAIRLGMEVGLDKVTAAARELGLRAHLAEVPSMALGTSEVSLLDLTAAFGSVQAGHPRLEPWGISAFGAEGSALRYLSPPEQVSKDLLFHRELVELLRGVVQNGTGHAAALLDGSSAGKTGTSQDHRDAWFVGFDRSLIVGVWVGNDDRTPMNGVTGGSAPAQIWKQFVEVALPLVDKVVMPPKPQEPSFAPSAPAPAELPQCDVAACSAAYSSFRASDCTYQPYSGPRRVCGGGETRSIPTALTMRDEIPTSRNCNENLCQSRYRSFDRLTCTYQPYSRGPRRLCDDAH